MQTFKLKNPFYIRGELITEIKYDYDNFTGSDYLSVTDLIDVKKTIRLAFYLAAGVMIASNREKNWTPDDFVTLKGADCARFFFVGQNFMGLADDMLPQGSSEEPSASTPSVSTPPSES